MGNPYRYEPGWTIEQHRDELIDRLGRAIRRINELEAILRKLVEACDSEGSQDAFGYIAVDIADEASELLK